MSRFRARPPALSALPGITFQTWQRLAAGLLLAVCVSARADEFDTLRAKWVDMLTGGSGYDARDPIIASAITSVTNTANSHWSALNKSANRPHLWSDAASATVSADINSNYSRLRAMALAYRTTGSPLQGNTTLRDDILAGLDWMHANRYNENVRIYDNWWHFEIGSPMALVDLVALMYADLSAAQLANTMRAVEKFTPSATTQAPGGSSGTFTGANRMWKIQVVTIRGILVKDDAKLRAARDAFSNLFLYVTSGDGFYTDGSFMQHGRHPYTGGYGAALIGNISQILALFNGPNADRAEGSTWRVTDPNLRNVVRWVYDSYEPLIYRGGMMAMTQGREISRSGTSEHGTGHAIMQSILRIAEFALPEDRTRMRAMVKYWAESDTSRNFVSTVPLALKVDVQNLMSDASVTARGELLGNHVFAAMDRVVHLRPGFGIGLSMSSSRVYTYESINSENLRAWHTGDGMTYLYNGDLTHFADAFWPTVNPRRLPGTTVDATQNRTNGSGQSTAPASTWVGGASLGTYGAAGMQLRGWNNTLRANKSWFMFDDEVICVGGGITSTDNRTIETTIENRLLNGSGTNAFTVGGTAQPTTPGWSETLTGVRWAHLAGRAAGSDIGFYFPQPTTMKALRETRTGAWSDINAGGATTPITRHYMTLWLDHGSNPTGGSYAYVLLPGRTASQAGEYAAQPAIAVLENSAAVHAVRESVLGITAANFWNDARTSAGGITVDRKACVVVQERGGIVDLAVSDPTQANSGSITVELATTVRGVLHVDPGVTVSQLEPAVRLVINVAGARGRTLKARFSATDTRRAALSNLSTRAYVAPRESVMIGFVVSGSGTKRLLVRAVGPGLTTFGVPDAVRDPLLTLVNEGGATVGANDNWEQAGNGTELAAAFASVGAFGLAPGSRDAALVVVLPAGPYSAVVRNNDPANGGIALVEVYDTAPTQEPRLINLSSRVFAGVNTQAAIVGFSLSGDGSRQVLVRAAGPALSPFNVPAVLPDPHLRIVAEDSSTLAQNDDWSSSALAADVAGAASATGAFAFSPGAKDAATVATLNPGSYTAVVSDPGNRTGTALVEVYDASLR